MRTDDGHVDMEQDIQDAKEFFALARRVNSALNTHCRQRTPKPSDNIKFLWMYVSRRGINQPASENAGDAPGLERWLNVVDEAAALGVRWLVITLQESLSSCADVWEICSWAQQAHDMTVGIHTEAAQITDDERRQLRALDISKTRLFVPRDAMERFADVEKVDGIKLRSAEPEPGTIGHACDKPGAMVFVNPEGMLYTCGMVQDNEDYCLGRAEGRRFDGLADNARHTVPPEHIRNEHGCDGCPPLLARHLQED